jgi:hypothetical protein
MYFHYFGRTSSLENIIVFFVCNEIGLTLVETKVVVSKTMTFENILKELLS